MLTCSSSSERKTIKVLSWSKPFHINCTVSSWGGVILYKEGECGGQQQLQSRLFIIVKQGGKYLLYLSYDIYYIIFILFIKNHNDCKFYNDVTLQGDDGQDSCDY